MHPQRPQRFCVCAKHLAVMRGYDVHLPDQLGCVPEMEDMDEIFLD